MMWLLILFAMGWAATPSPTCESYHTLCGDVCTKDAVNGEEVNPLVCPAVADEDGVVRPQCLVCKSGETCETETGECVPTSSLLGKACSTDAQCNPFIPDLLLPPLVCVGTCQLATNYAYPGDACQSSADCYGPASCNSSDLCDNTGSCSEDGHCNGDMYCDGGSCEFRKDFGAACSTSSECPVIQVCGATNLCQNAFTVGTGAVCSDPPARKYACANGLQCVQQGMTTLWECEVQDIAPNNGDCNPSVVLDCNEQFSCGCNITTGRGQCFRKQVVNFCANEWKAHLECIYGANCNIEATVAFPGSCIAENCGEEYGLAVECSERFVAAWGNENCLVGERVAVELGGFIRGPDVGDSASELINLFDY